MSENAKRIDALASGHDADDCGLTRDELITLLSTFTAADREYAASVARSMSLTRFGNAVYTRGLMEISNYCRNDCLYCGIRRDNRNVVRYRLTKDDILTCCEAGYELGFRTFVMQGGEDAYFTDDRIAEIVSEIRRRYPDCAITLSLGEKPRDAYRRFYDAGATRYLLRHETARREHYYQLHPIEMSFENRMRCLDDLKEIGYQTGCGPMIGSPYQTDAHLADDLLFMSAFKPQMVGMGPFIPQHDTPFRDMQSGAGLHAGSVDTTLMMISLVRIMLPKALIPATTALGTAERGGRERGVLAGANVVMPNLSPLNVRRQYALYDGKLGVSDDAAASMDKLARSMEDIGYRLACARGDYVD